MRRMSKGVLALSALGVALSLATPVSAQSTSSFAQQVLDLTNQQRAAAGLQPLHFQSQLIQCAQGYAGQLDSGIPFSHTGPDGSTPFSRMQAAGYRGPIMGENIARGFATPQDVMTAWMNSPGHRANILYPNYTQIGIGVAGNSWVQDFGAGGAETGGAPASPSETPTAPQPIATQPLNPTITGVQPSSAHVGDAIAIQGQRFGSSGTVSFSGGVIGDATSWTDSQINLPVPNGAKSGPLYVQTQNGTASSGTFYVLDMPSATSAVLQSLNPSTGGPGTSIWVYGQNFGATAGSVTFGGVPGTIQFWSPSGYYIRAAVPQGAQSGNVVVTRADGGTSNALSFNVTGGGSQPGSGAQPSQTPNTPVPVGNPPSVTNPTPTPTPAPTPSTPSHPTPRWGNRYGGGYFFGRYRNPW